MHEIQAACLVRKLKETRGKVTISNKKLGKESKSKEKLFKVRKVIPMHAKFTLRKVCSLRISKDNLQQVRRVMKVRKNKESYFICAICTRFRQRVYAKIKVGEKLYIFSALGGSFEPQSVRFAPPVSFCRLIGLFFQTKKYREVLNKQGSGPS